MYVYIHMTCLLWSIYLSLLCPVTVRAFSILNPLKHKMDNWIEFLGLSVAAEKCWWKNRSLFSLLWMLLFSRHLAGHCWVFYRTWKVQNTQKGVLVCTVSDSYLLHRLHCSFCRSFVLYSLFVSLVGWLFCADCTVWEWNMFTNDSLHCLVFFIYVTC